MAGDYDGYRISVVCHADGPASLFIAYSYCDILIASGFAIRDLLKGFPYSFLKIGAFYLKGQVKFLALSFKI
jgi:hypothetical protein